MAEASDVQLTIPRAMFQEMRDTIKTLSQALDAAEMKVKADEKLAGSIPLDAQAAPPDGAPPDPLAGFGAELNNQSLGG